ncbi:hypothetical protein V8C86DRAFT_2609894 [Haematococcus lacustris]
MTTRSRVNTPQIATSRDELRALPPTKQNGTLPSRLLHCAKSAPRLLTVAALCTVHLHLQPPDVLARQPHVEAVKEQHPAQPILQLSLFGGGEERDPIAPFTLNGTVLKKFVIEQLSGEKILSRRRGFTVDTCVSSMAEADETPTYQMLPLGGKVTAAANVLCSHAEGSDLGSACVDSCQGACSAALDSRAEEERALSGFVLLSKDKERLLKSCTRECALDCKRPGKAYSFSTPYRK